MNKGIGPDRRYKNNPKLSIMHYGQLIVAAHTGFNFIWQMSNATAASALSTAISAVSSRPGHAAALAGPPHVH